MRESSKMIPHTPKKFPNYGKGHCLYCGKELTGRQRKYCSEWCGYWYRRETATTLNYTWAQLRSEILDRDGWICQDKSCGVDLKTLPEGDVEVHHIKPISEGGSMWDRDNLISYCIRCHRIRHRNAGNVERLKREGKIRSLEEY